jgi:hypothetical protein
MKSAIVTVLCVAGFAIWTPCHAQTQTVPVVITSDYYAQPKVLVLHALNNSGKDITGYIFIIRHKNPDGTVDKGGGWSSTMSDMLSMLITTQMAKDGAASERIRQQDSGNKVFASAGNGIFLAGETRDTTLTGINSGSELDITAGAVFYVDGSYDQQDEDAFKQMLAYRQHQLQQMKDTDELIRNALVDEANVHPVAVVLTQLNKRRVEEMDKPGQRFPMDLSDSELRSMQQSISYGPMKGKTERERLTQYVEEQEKKVELMTPHCHLEIALKAAGPDSAK